MLELQTPGFYYGTSNITLPGNKQSFPVQFHHKTRLHYYSTLFNSLEVNSSFYKVPMSRTFAKWASEVDGDFRFTIKLWKGITHNKGLIFEHEDVLKFLDSAAFIEPRQGCLLVQLPKSTGKQYAAQLRELLAAIRAHRSAFAWKIAVELRDPLWYTASTMKLLDKYEASLVQHDMPASQTNMINTAAGFVLLRFHGEKGDYRGSYSNEHLQRRANEVFNWLQQGKEVYAYFNNTIGSAYENALTFAGMVGKMYHSS
ncbi:MAG: DUF72 domain-containing protein [Chitinophagaceae bacterium]|nr:MAG: DUF72 domain-containing protein [Chitinophagaceae bacterium]